MIRRILVPLDTSPYTDAALDYACLVAKRQNAEVTGLVVMDIPGIEKSASYPGLGGSYWAEQLEDHLRKDAEAHVEKLLTKFRKRCEKDGITAVASKEQGSPSKRILAQSSFYDLIVVGMRTNFHFVTSDKPGDTLDKILDDSITPVLAVPAHFSPIKKVLISYDGSLAATRALQRFTHLSLARDLEIKVLFASDDKEKANYYLENISAYLNAYELTNFKTEWTDQLFIDALRQQYLDWADAIVLGAHSRSGLADFFVGSVTKFLIKEAKKPLFIGI